MAYLRQHISINIGHSSQPTPTDNLDAAPRSGDNSLGFLLIWGN
ncbi:hypothetical protein [Microcoleus sp. herbarium14]